MPAKTNWRRRHHLSVDRRRCGTASARWPHTGARKAAILTGRAVAAFLRKSRKGAMAPVAKRFQQSCYQSCCPKGKGRRARYRHRLRSGPIQCPPMNRVQNHALNAVCWGRRASPILLSVLAPNPGAPKSACGHAGWSERRPDHKSLPLGITFVGRARGPYRLDSDRRCCFMSDGHKKSL